jgi:transglutaminase-like putative cysteine protease
MLSGKDKGNKAIPALRDNKAVAAATLLLAVAFAPATRAAPAVTAAQPDGVIELWEQHWTLNDDGSTVFREKQHVRLNSDRTYREFADPRLTYNADTDKLEIITAHVKLPDGTYRELPDYSHVLVSPHETAGWPAFAAIRQHLLVMSGIEPGCVVELEYKITSKAGARPGFGADVRLDHRYPVLKRVVSITSSKDIQPTLTGPGTQPGAGGPAVSTSTTAGNAKPLTTKTWTFTNLPADPNEAHSPPWQARCPRFAFSSIGNSDAWMCRRTAEIERAADESPLTAKVAAEWTKDALLPAEKMRALQEKLADTFNVVEVDPDWQRGGIRPASETLRSGYGLPQEAAAVLLALGHAAGLPVRAAVVVNDDRWLEAAPHDSQVAAYVVLLDSGKEPQIWEAHDGRITRDGHWAGTSLLIMGDASAFRTPLAAWTDADDSRCIVGGTITLKPDGTYTGTVSLSTTGLFVAPEGLRSADAQKSRINAMVDRVLPDATVESFAVKELSDSEFSVEAKVKSSKALKKVGGAFWFEMPKDAPYEANVALPLAYSERSERVRITGPFEEQVSLTVEYPENWTIEAQPLQLKSAQGDWGEAEQRVTPGEHRLTILRTTRIAQRDLSPKAFLAARDPLNTLLTDAARTLVLKP